MHLYDVMNTHNPILFFYVSQFLCCTGSFSIMWSFRSCETSHYENSHNRSRVGWKTLAHHPTLYLQSGRWNCIIANTLMWNLCHTNSVHLFINCRFELTKYWLYNSSEIKPVTLFFVFCDRKGRNIINSAHDYSRNTVIITSLIFTFSECQNINLHLGEVKQY
jgi:hypothetical protein